MTPDLRADALGLEEQLREALVALEQATARERQTRLETEFLLESLRDLGFADRTSEVYQHALEKLRESIPFEEAFVLRTPFGNEPLRVVASTNERFADAVFEVGPHFERVKNGHVVPIFNIRAVKEWAEQPEALKEDVVSTLSIPVPQDIGAIIIVCASPDKGAFNAVSAPAAQRFGLLVAQALRMTRVREDELQSALVRLSSQAERDQTDFMLAAVDALGEGVFVIDSQQRIIVTNERYRQLYNELADMYVPGLNIEDIWMLERQSGFVAEMDNPEAVSIASPEGWIGTTRTNRHVLRDGKTVRATDRRLPNGWIVGVRVDISELAEKERDLTLARNEAEAANAVKSEFLATVSHEIRTPLNAILGMLGLIQRDPLTDTQQEFVSVAETSARNLLMLLTDILDVSKMEAGKLSLEQEDVVLQQIVRDVVRLYRDAAEAKHIKLEWELDDALPVAVRSDGGRLRQVMINFASNAIKFTDDGSVTIRVVVSNRDPGAHDRVALRFEVQDTGAGIAEEAQERLFQPFEQVGASVEKRQGGTGLGLNICSRIAAAMEGKVGAHSEPGVGSTFWFEVVLPVKEGSTVPQEIHKPIEAHMPERAEQPLRLLFADDSPSNQLLIRAMLEPTGHRVDIVSNGLEAVRALETLPYDIAFFDISMPEMDGREALAQSLKLQKLGALARQEDNPDIAPLPFIALTANVMRGDEETYRADGFDDVVGKPFSEDDLIGAIAQYKPTATVGGPAASAAETPPPPAKPAPEPSVAGEQDEEDPIDHKVLSRLAETFGSDFFRTSIDIFSEEMDGRIAVLEKAASGSEDVVKEAHAIKGSAASYGLKALSATAAGLERAPVELSRALPEMKRQWAQAKPIMEALL